MDFQKLTAPCGLDCFNCLFYLASSNESIRAMLVTKTGLPQEKLICKGCREQGGKIPFLNNEAPCQVYQCIASNGKKFCCECDDFPCDFLHPYADKAGGRMHNAKVFNLCLIKKMGLEKWARTRAKSIRDTYFNDPLKL